MPKIRVAASKFSCRKKGGMKIKKKSLLRYKNFQLQQSKVLNFSILQTDCYTLPSADFSNNVRVYPPLQPTPLPGHDPI